MPIGLRPIIIGILAALSSMSTIASASGSSSSFRIASSLDGMTVLPHRITWLGLPTLPASQIKEVDFLVDGTVDWIEKSPPYSYSDDGGYLVTSWLSPGLHRFTVRALATGGRVATDTVRARVLAAPMFPPH